MGSEEYNYGNMGTELQSSADDEDYFHRIEEPDDASLMYGPPVAMGLISAFGLIFNAVVVLVICALQDYKKTSHWYVLNLAIADSIFLMMLPLNLIEYLFKYWSLGEPLCIAFNTAFYTNYYAGIFFLTAMSFDRYAAIIYPMSPTWRKFRSKQGCMIATGIVWVLAVLAALPLILKTKVIGTEEGKGRCVVDFHPGTKEGHCVEAGVPLEHCEKYNRHMEEFVGSGGGFHSLDDYEYDEWMDTISDIDPHCNHPRHASLVVWTWCNFLLTFLIPIFVLIFCYGCILWRVLHPRISSRSLRGSKGSGKSYLKNNGSSKFRSAKQRSNHRVTLMVVSLVIAFFVCWAPFHITSLAKLYGMGLSSLGCRKMETAAVLMAYSNSLFNPLLYTFLGANFHKRVSKVWNQIKVRNAATKELLASFKKSNRSDRSRLRGSVTSKTTKTTYSHDSAALPNINMQPLSTQSRMDQTFTSTGCKV